MKTVILDLYCSAGGASKGYAKAYPGMTIVGVDIEPQKNYPYHFIQFDALDVLDMLLAGMAISIGEGEIFDLEDVLFVHASPPCQAYSTLKALHKTVEYPDLVEPTRDRLVKLGVPYIIENVVGAPLRNPVMLCGTMFGLGASDGGQLIRHRLFETSFKVDQPDCKHNGGRTVGVYGHPGGSSKRDGIQFYKTQDWKDAMGIDWMTGKELAQSIPPAYTEFIGRKIKCTL